MHKVIVNNSYYKGIAVKSARQIKAETKNAKLKKIAKDTLLDAIGCAYYRIADSDDYTEDEKDVIIQYINKYGKAACKAFGMTYITY